ncbi:MAG: putative cytosol aminopeptidase [Acidimicrobiales bacterium]|nr:MAG: leucyl aminopeptidase [Actinomycetota bacterium]MBV6510108.1 putative cytosol aminopeptidase [Acidimicrobiales bacterium]RIK03600.1 MAG: leucyl aminopeptidase [Acidobacteriota bacterium]
MPIDFELTRQVPPDAEAVGIPVAADALGSSDSPLDRSFLEKRGFKAKAGEVMACPGAEGGFFVAVGVGEAGNVDPAVLRRAAAGFARVARREQVVALCLLDALPEGADKARGAQAVAEGVALGAYEFDEYKSESEPSAISTVAVVGTGGKRIKAALDRGAAVADGVAFARDLANEPGGSLTPRRLAEAATDMAKRVGLAFEVLDEKRIRAEKLGALLGVNRGSAEPARFVKLVFEPPSARSSLALVGKGITFDAGGLSIKTAEQMSAMKGDMSGAATVMGAMSVLPAIGARTEVTAYLPMTDNMLGGDAMRPGDVLTARNGKTIEVLNTDAEGRLILADALALASEDRPDAIVDVATLTGACAVALGTRIAGLMGNGTGLVEQVEAAAGRAGERVWRLPLPEDYRRQLDSNVADLKNVGTRHGGALTAALFLREFVAEGIPWAHLDIAGPAFADAVDGENPKGATGFGVRTLIELVASFTKPK